MLKLKLRGLNRVYEHNCFKFIFRIFFNTFNIKNDLTYFLILFSK